jgi:hypothetical protein
MKVALAGCRGLLGGWIVAVTIPLLLAPAAIAQSSVIGLGDRSRIALASAEILGALLFPFQRVVTAGAVLLLAAFLVAAALHFHHGEWPWRLGAYAAAVIVLERFTIRASFDPMLAPSAAPPRRVLPGRR